MSKPNYVTVDRDTFSLGVDIRMLNAAILFGVLALAASTWWLLFGLVTMLIVLRIVMFVLCVHNTDRTPTSQKTESE